MGCLVRRGRKPTTLTGTRMTRRSQPAGVSSPGVNRPHGLAARREPRARLGSASTRRRYRWIELASSPACVSRAQHAPLGPARRFRNVRALPALAWGTNLLSRDASCGPRGLALRVARRENYIAVDLRGPVLCEGGAGGSRQAEPSSFGVPEDQQIHPEPALPMCPPTSASGGSMGFFRAQSRFSPSRWAAGSTSILTTGDVGFRAALFPRLPRSPAFCETMADDPSFAPDKSPGRWIDSRAPPGTDQGPGPQRH